MARKASDTVTVERGPSSGEDDPQYVALEEGDAAATGRYERSRILGRGGMGTVVLVHDRSVGRNVALKELNEDSKTSDVCLARFSREARVQGQLEHPAIVPVYDVGTGPDGLPFFTMKRVRGRSLDDVLARMARNEPTEFSRRKLLSAFSQLCAAAHYAHERGVVHRDIKPRNVMLGSYGEVYLLDWGVAKIASEVTDRLQSSENIDAGAGFETGYGSILGSSVTMSPEQAVGGEVDARSDVYSLGAVLFEILTLQPLHPRGTFEEVAKKITVGIEARASVRAPDALVPPELEALCVAATRLEPADRLASAMSVRDAIETYLDGDRDLELRRASARQHAEAALAAADVALGAPAHAIASGSGESAEVNAHAAALSEVGKALALDPENKEALGTLVRLLTTPPKGMPREVAMARETDHRRNIRRGGIAAAAVYGYISLNALSTWKLGVHDVRIFTTAHVLWGLALVMSVVTILRPSYWALLATFLFGITTSAYITSVYGPYLVVSTLITMHAVLFAFVRDWLPRIMVIVLACAAWTASVFGEAFGLFPDTVRFVDGDMVIHSNVIGFAETSTTVYLYAAVLATIIAPALVVGALRTAYHRSQEATLLQSWQLQRLVTRSGAIAPR